MDTLVLRDYHGSTMAQKRSGRTVKVSVSLDKEDLAVLRDYAETSHEGNLSAAFAEAARWIRQRHARRRVVELLGGSTLTPRARDAIDAEQAGGPQKRKSRRAA